MVRLAGLLSTRLAGLRVAIDVQHLYRPAKPKDHGAVFTLGDGTHTTEGAIALHYAQHLADWLRARGATVFTNDPGTAGTLVAHDPNAELEAGSYQSRQLEANRLGVHAYLACHVNAGGGSYAAVEALNGSCGIGLAARIVAKLVAAFPELRTSRVVRLNPKDRGGVCIRYMDANKAGVLLEPLFGDTRAHQAIYTDHARLVDLADAVGAGVAAWTEGGAL